MASYDICQLLFIVATSVAERNRITKLEYNNAPISMEKVVIYKNIIPMQFKAHNSATHESLLIITSFNHKDGSNKL